MSHLDLMRRKSTGHALVLAAQERHPTNGVQFQSSFGTDTGHI